MKRLLIFLFFALVCFSAEINIKRNINFLAPSSYFKNTFREINSIDNEADIAFFKQKIADSKGKVAFLSYRYIPKKDNNYNVSILNNSVVLDEDSQLKLIFQYLNKNQMVPVFVVRKSEIPVLRGKLQILFNDKDFILLPCGDTYERWPLLEDQYGRFSDQYWTNTGSLLDGLGAKKAFYLGDESAEVLSRKQMSGSLYDANKIKFTYSDILAKYGELTSDVQKALLESGSVQHLATRENLPVDAIRAIVRMNEYFLFRHLLSNDYIDSNVLLKILEEEMKYISPRTYESMLDFLFKDGKETNKELKQGLLFLVCRNLDRLNAQIEYTDINIFNATWNLSDEGRGEIFNALYLQGFSDWQKIFKGDNITFRQQQVLLPLFKEYPFVAAAIVGKLASEDVEYLFKIIDWLESEEDVDLEKIFYKAIDSVFSLEELKELFKRNDIPVRVKFFILLRAYQGENTEDYISSIKKYYEKEEVNEALNNARLVSDIHSGFNIWLSIVALNPKVVEFMQEEKVNFPASIKGNVTLFVSDKRNYDFLEKYLSLFKDALSPDSVFSINNIPDIIIKTINASLVVPSPDSISVFTDILEVWDKEKNTDIFDLNFYPNLSLPARYSAARTGDKNFAEVVDKIYGFDEIKSHRGTRFKISSVLLNPNISVFADVISLIFNRILADSESKTTRESLVSVCESLWLFMTLPDEKEIAEKLYLSLLSAEKQVAADGNQLSEGKNILYVLRNTFIDILRTSWNMEIRKDLPLTTVYQRLSDVESFWTYYAQWKSLLNGKSGDKDVLNMIDILKKAVQNYVNYGKDIKDLKYGGTLESAKQLEIMELLLNDIWGEDENIEAIMDRQKQDIRHRVKIKNGKVLHCYATDTLPFWLNRGYYGGGTCASPASSPGYTKCVNGVTFSALSRRVVVSNTEDGKEGIVSETKAITEVNGKKVPVVLNEHLYIAHTLPEGLSKSDISEAAVIASLKNAAIYGIPYLYFVEENTNMSEPTNFSFMEKYDGYSTEIEYVDENGNIVKKMIKVTKIKEPNRRTFYHLKENNRWKYSDNSLYLVGDDNRLEKTYENMNIIDFDFNGVRGEIAGKDCEYVANVLGGSLFSLETEIISVEKIDTIDRFQKMYPEYDEKTMGEKVAALEEKLQKKELVIAANETLHSERTRGKETTLGLIKSIEDPGVAADYYLSKVYKLSTVIGEVISSDLNDLLADASVKKLMVGIPRAGIPIVSRLKKVLKTKKVSNIGYELMDVDRDIYNQHVIDASLDAVFLCDQVINTGRTIGKNIELILKHNPDVDIYVVSPVTADPNAVMRLYRKYPQIKKIYIGDIRRRIESKKGISSPVGHPGERSYPQAYEALFTKGNIVKVYDRNLEVMGAISESYFNRTFKVKDIDTGELFRLKIMVSAEEGLVEESISTLAKEENLESNTLIKGVKFYPQNAFLLSPYTNGQTLEQVITGDSFDKNYKLKMLLRDLKDTVKFFKKYNRFPDGFTVDSILWDEVSKSWKITGFFNSQRQGENLEESSFLSSVFGILESAKNASPNMLYHIMKLISSLDAGVISDIDSLILALEELNLEKAPEKYMLQAA